MATKATKHRKVYEQFYESNGYGTVEVLRRTPEGKLRVKFLNTGYETESAASNIKAGKVRDFSVPRADKHDWEPWDEDFVNTTGTAGKIISKNAKYCIVQFCESGYTTQANIFNVRLGKVADPYAKTFLGIGYLGEYEHPPYWKQAKQLWSNMMKRCYNPKDYNGYFGYSFVDTRWQCFANFLEDIPSLPNFEGWLNSKETGLKYNLDKDLKVEGNKTYSKELCMFVTEYENKHAGGLKRKSDYKTSGIINDGNHPRP